MGISIVLRKNQNISLFRRELFKLISTPNTNKLLLCSGYVQEIITNYKGKKTNYTVLGDGLWNEIQKACKGEKFTIETVAGKFWGLDDWLKSYDNFVNELTTNAKNVKGCSVNVEPFIAPRGNWHAKVAMVLAKEGPLAAIIGSSNLTRSAFGEGYSWFNHECDVTIWKDVPDLDAHFQEDKQYRNHEFSDLEPEWEPILAILKPGIDQAQEASRLTALYDEIMRQGLLVDYRTWRKKFFP
jgi:hypothetical protein